MPPPEPHSTRALLAESAWLHRLALRLVAEPAGAADAAQETLAKTLARAPGGLPGETASLRKWLAAVLRNVVRQERRARARREERERVRPLALTGEPADELATRLELQEKLVAAVRALDEPYRTTIALRFLDDLAPPVVAARMGVPLKTVHTRIERALAQLRERLDRESGGRATWLRALVPLASPVPIVPASSAGPAVAPLGLLAPFIAMGTLWKWTGACAALAVLGFMAVRTLDGSEPRAALAPVADVEHAASPRADPAPAALEAPPAPDEREVVAPEAAEPRASDAAVLGSPAVAPVLAGFVQDLERRPVACLTVAYERIAPTRSRGEDAPAVSAGSAASDEGGRFELPLPGGPCRIVAAGKGYATVFAPALAGPPPPEPPIVFVGAERRYAGQVVDAGGAPVAGAELGIFLERALARALTPGTFVGGSALAKVASDGDGRFEFPAIGAAPASYVFASAQGFQGASLELPPGSSDTLLVTLLAARRDERVLAGSVLRSDGGPASGAYVSIGAAAVRAGDDGAFELELAADARPERVRAVLPGLLPAERVLGELAPDEELVLVLGDEPRTIAGRVRDGAGEPVSGARVWTDDGERFGDVATEVGDVSFHLTFDVEGVIAGPDEQQRDGRKTRSGADGGFELTGLLERRYALWAMHPDTLELAGPFEVSAGSAGVVLVLPGEPARRVAGRVTTLGGEPIAGANVGVARERHSGDGRVRSHRAETDARVATDPEGRFAFPKLCVDGTRLLVSLRDATNEISFPLAEQRDPEDLVFAVPATCHLRVLLDDPESADSLGLLDERDEGLFFTFQIGTALCSSAGVQIEGGVSDLLTTDERARTLVLRKGATEVERVPLRLRPGEVNEIRH